MVKKLLHSGKFSDIIARQFAREVFGSTVQRRGANDVVTGFIALRRMKL